MISIYSKENTHTFSLHYPVLLLCPFALYCVQNKDDHAYAEITEVTFGHPIKGKQYAHMYGPIINSLLTKLVRSRLLNIG